MRKLLTFVLTAILSVSIIFGQPLSAYAVPAAIPALASLLGTTVLSSAVGTATSSLVNSWLGVDRGYYNGSGSSTSFDYSNNMSRTTNLTAGGNITSSGANNENCWNTYTTSSTTNNNYSLTRNHYDMDYNDYRTQIFNPVTNEYHTVNNVKYTEDYDTYYVQSNDYDYYVTNNYNYVSYYVTNNSTYESYYYEIYFEMPDGRNSYDLEKEDVWGEYFIYDVVAYDSVAEDDGKTLALYHFDGNLKDSSFHQNRSVVGGSGVYQQGKFGDGYLTGDDSESIYLGIDGFSPHNFTCEFVMTITQKGHCYSFGITDGGISTCYHMVFDGSPGVYSLVIQNDNGSVSCYVNGSKIGLIARDSSYNYGNLTPDSMYHINSSFVEFYDHVSSNDSDIRFRSFDVIESVPSLGSYVSRHRIKFLLDELRISNSALYSGSSIDVMSQPFDTNDVLVVPSVPTSNMIAVKGAYPISDGSYRIGGVRPTYPTDGFVYVALENDVVSDVQQFQGDGWVSVPASFYRDNSWVELKGSDITDLSARPSYDSGDSDSDDDSGSSGSGGGSVSGNGFGSFADGLGSIVDAVSGFFGMLLDAIGKIVTLITDFFSSFLTMFDGFTAFTEGFGNFLSSAFGFLPTEIVSALVVGINICIVIAVFKFMRH